MPVIFELKSTTTLGLDARNLNPDRIAGLSLDQVRAVEIGYGCRKASVSQWFDVSGDGQDEEVIFAGSMLGVHGIGHSLTRGRIEVHGSADRHVGDSMSGGEIVIRGDVGDFVGYEMQGGKIVIHGNAGNHVGGCYPGAKYGMNRGTILIAGNAGDGLGFRMRRGTIVVGGDVGEHVAWQMRAGTIVVCGSCGGTVGVDMKRGTVLTGGLKEIGQTFVEGQKSSSPIVAMLLSSVAGLAERYGVELAMFEAEQFQTWHGDQLAGGRGELFAIP